MSLQVNCLFTNGKHFFSGIANHMYFERSGVQHIEDHPS